MDGEMLAVKQLRKSFGSQVVLKDINFSVTKGQILAILGKSGTGKSVLLRCIIGLETPDSGAIKVLGENIVGLEREKLHAVRKKMGFLFQQAALYDSLTIAENVEFPLKRHSEMSASDRTEQVRNLLESVGLKNDLDKLPSAISGGMRKRVGLARALALNPEIVLFDEPTAGLDPITAAEIGQLIQKVRDERNMTSIIVTHDMHAARHFCDRLVMLKEGSILVDGSFEDLQQSQDAFVAQFLSDAA
jgi:phospholipid/cholesterol/gamma-HCH transport system ATP-binding protein